MSVLPELLPVAITLALRRLSGPINFTNPGAISHNEILELCRTYVYPELTWSNFTVEEQNKILKAPRSNNTLNTSKVRVGGRSQGCGRGVEGGCEGGGAMATALCVPT